MKLEYALGLLIAVLVFLLISMATETWDWPTDKQIGKTYWEIAKMVEECEAILPRSQHCQVGIVMEIKTNVE